MMYKSETSAESNPFEWGVAQGSLHMKFGRPRIDYYVASPYHVQNGKLIMLDEPDLAVLPARLLKTDVKLATSGEK
ncbi:hypothetical protein BH11ARM1_BH11ARM1_01660 [soil metagenome]